MGRQRGSKLRADEQEPDTRRYLPGRTGHGLASEALRPTTLNRQRDQECGRQRVWTQVPGLHLLGGSRWRHQTQGRGKATEDVQAAHSLVTPPQGRAKPVGGLSTAAALCLGMEGLLPVGANSKGLANAGRMDAPSDTGDSTQALEARQNHVQGTYRFRRKTQCRETGGGQ